METVLEFTHRRVPILSMPFWLGLGQAAVIERLPTNLFTITRDQVCTDDRQLRYDAKPSYFQIRQLQKDNIVNPNPGPDYISFEKFLQQHCSQNLTPMANVLPTYL